MEAIHKKYQDSSKNLSAYRTKKLKLERNSEFCDVKDLDSYCRDFSDQHLLVELFSGAGGLSLGLERAGFRNVLAVDKLQDSVETHACHFPGASINCDISDEKTLEELVEPLRNHQISLLAGGPPCQPFSKPLRWARNKDKMELGSLKDHRRELWQSFVYGVKLLKPLSVLLENVSDIATNEDGIILRNILESLENLGYSCDVQAFHAFDFGVPQTRLRLFLVAVHNEIASIIWPKKSVHKPTLREAISDLPRIKGGWDEKTGKYQGPLTDLQKRLRSGIPDGEEFNVSDHVTRRVREDDLEAFRLLKAGQKYSELPEEKRRYSIKSFTDKYNRLKWDEPCRTITAHMSRDGYWYIHPEQDRTLSIREAARVQSFPDWFRFAGFRSSAFYQIGEAVAPFVAEEIGESIISMLGKKKTVTKALLGSPPENRIRKKKILCEWMKEEGKFNTNRPWIHEKDFWLSMLGEMLFSSSGRKSLWNDVREDWPSARHFLEDENRQELLKAMVVGEEKENLINDLAVFLISEEEADPAEFRKYGLKDTVLKFIFASSGLSLQRPPSKPVTRVARRLIKRKQINENGLDDQIVTSLLTGVDEGADIFIAAQELGDTICKKDSPACSICCVKHVCHHYYQYTLT